MEVAMLHHHVSIVAQNEEHHSWWKNDVSHGPSAIHDYNTGVHLFAVLAMGFLPLDATVSYTLGL